MSIRNILAIAVGLSLSATAFADGPLVKMQFDGPLVKVAASERLAKLAYGDTLAKLGSTAPSRQTTAEAKKPASRASNFQALYGGSPEDDDKAIADAVNKSVDTKAKSQIRGLLGKPEAPKNQLEK